MVGVYPNWTLCVAYHVPERQFLTGHLSGHSAPKRAVEPGNCGGVYAGRPACGRYERVLYEFEVVSLAGSWSIILRMDAGCCCGLTSVLTVRPWRAGQCSFGGTDGGGDSFQEVDEFLDWRCSGIGDDVCDSCQVKLEDRVVG